MFVEKPDIGTDIKYTKCSSDARTDKGVGLYRNINNNESNGSIYKIYINCLNDAYEKVYTKSNRSICSSLNGNVGSECYEIEWVSEYDIERVIQINYDSHKSYKNTVTSTSKCSGNYDTDASAKACLEEKMARKSKGIHKVNETYYKKLLAKEKKDNEEIIKKIGTAYKANSEDIGKYGNTYDNPDKSYNAEETADALWKAIDEDDNHRDHYRDSEKCKIYACSSVDNSSDLHMYISSSMKTFGLIAMVVAIKAAM